MLDAYIYEGVRSPFGRYGGALADLRTDDLLAGVLRGLVQRADLDRTVVEDVIIGCASQAGEDSRNVARRASLMADMAVSSGAITVNRLCGSGLSALIEAARAVHCGDGGMIVCGGVESMSRAPLVISKADRAYGRDQQLADATIGPRFPSSNYAQMFGLETMPETAENVAKEMRIDRDAADEYANMSQKKYAAARDRGFFRDEMIPIDVSAEERRPHRLVTSDEHPRPNTTLDKLSRLKPLKKGGIVTAGNSAGINDGAAALLVGNAVAGRKAGLRPRAQVVSSAVVGVAPRTMGLGPVPASKRALQRAGLTLGDMDVIEINEAFACQVLACLKQLGLSPRDERVNPCGGAIAIGHPLGASGSRLALTAIRQLEHRDQDYAMVTLCVGEGQGIAAVLKRV